MKIIKITSISEDLEITVPINNIEWLEKDHGDYYVRVKDKWIEVDEEQFNKIKETMEEL